MRIASGRIEAASTSKMMKSMPVTRYLTGNRPWVPSMLVMPDSYGESLAGLGRLGPRMNVMAIVRTAKHKASAIRISTGSTAGMREALPTLVATTLTETAVIPVALEPSAAGCGWPYTILGGAARATPIGGTPEVSVARAGVRVK